MQLVRSVPSRSAARPWPRRPTGASSARVAQRKSASVPCWRPGVRLAPRARHSRRPDRGTLSHRLRLGRTKRPRGSSREALSHRPNDAMETTRSPHGVPAAPPSGGDGGGMTRHSHDQLQPVDADTPDRELLSGETVYIELTGHGQRLAYVAFPETREPYAVVHTAGDFPTPKKWEGRQRFEEVLKPKMKPWSANAQERQLLKMARDGAYDAMADEAGFTSPISYVLHEIEQGSKSSTTDAPQGAEGMA